MLIVIRKGRAWYKDKVGQVFDVEDNTITLGGIEKYRMKVPGGVKLIRVSDAAPIRPGLVEFIKYHEQMIESDKRIPVSARLHPTVSRMIREKQELLDLIKVMAPIFETVYHNTLEKLGAQGRGNRNHGQEKEACGSITQRGIEGFRLEETRGNRHHETNT